ncbi:right-handed parallel beta-helix repeat-containing protein [Paenibacillus hexagrammi]|uniref:Right-handed parallel beta-helix repeat-containing protein n=1 Tax=Paenibacillus hexagrammi TaxID=2908839 RepID=A0ABY3SK26_9BACL|nr:right-handed parallel beta-helix repeat-containing protein [Paenibacillus sp. YPD9-1]UJF33327.1 right-handed parallel beta-helix repeat-containing protein [Paenibacillus sp. YPD9-1]
MNPLSTPHDLPQESATSSSSMSRRKLLSALGASGLAIAAGGLFSTSVAQAAASSTPIYNVKDYGVYGNSRPDQDDAPAIQNVLDTAALNGGIVYFPPGMYFIQSSLRVGSNVILLGAGKNTILKSFMNKFGLLNLSAVSNVQIHRMAFQGMGSFSASYVPLIENGISLTKAADIYISECYFSQIENGIKSVDSSRVTISSCIFDSILGALDYAYLGFGIWCNNADSHRIEYNDFNQLFQACISLNNGTKNSVVAHNRMSRCFTIAIDISAQPSEDPCKQNIISENIIEEFINSSGKTGYTLGIRLKGNCISNQVTRNMISDIDDGAIRIESKGSKQKERPHFNTIEQNTIQTIRKSGIVVLNSYANRVHANNIRDCKGNGILLYSEGKDTGSSCSNNHITANSLVNCSSAPIRISDANCKATIQYGNIGSGNGDTIIDKGTDTITTSL